MRISILLPDTYLSESRTSDKTTYLFNLRRIMKVYVIVNKIYYRNGAVAGEITIQLIHLPYTTIT